jgi:hypothetical protein
LCLKQMVVSWEERTANVPEKSSNRQVLGFRLMGPVGSCQFDCSCAPTSCDDSELVNSEPVR